MVTAFTPPSASGSAECPTTVITNALCAIDHKLAHMPAKTAMQLIEFCRSRLSATEARVLADHYENGASDRDVEDLAGSAGGASKNCLLYTSPSPRDQRGSRMPSSA